MTEAIQALTETILSTHITPERKLVLEPLIQYIQNCKTNRRTIALNFICTHNSRRSQFSQLWAQVAANYYGVTAHCYSSGVEVTSCNTRTIASLKRFGFECSYQEGENPVYKINFSPNSEPVVLFSKLINDPVNPLKDFASVMTCSHADENCPLIPGAEKRIPIRYDDPKKYDDSKLEEIMYDQRSMQIASEMFYVFAAIA